MIIFQGKANTKGKVRIGNQMPVSVPSPIIRVSSIVERVSQTSINIGG